MFARAGDAKSTDPSFSYFIYRDSEGVSTWDSVTKTSETIGYCNDVGTAFDWTGVCKNDEETPEECLNSWIDGYDVYGNHNVNYDFCGTSNIWNRHFSHTHDYLLKYGGCTVNDRSVDVYFEQPQSTWDDVDIATGDKINQYAEYGRDCPSGKVCKKFNMQYNNSTAGNNNKDRVGFRIPKNTWNGAWTMSYQN